MTCSRCNAVLRETNEGAGLCDPCTRSGREQGVRTLLQTMLAGGLEGGARCADPRFGFMSSITDAMFFPEYGPAERERRDTYEAHYGIRHIDAGSEMAMRGTAMCMGCPVQEACLRSSFIEAGSSKTMHVGIRGGVSQTARRRFHAMARHNLEESVHTLLGRARGEARMLALIEDEKETA